MTVKSHECVTFACDACGKDFETDDGFVHYPDEATAADFARDYEWFADPDTGFALCGDDDEKHMAAALEVRSTAGPDLLDDLFFVYPQLRPENGDETVAAESGAAR